jgi:hypothetical protein
MTLAAEVMWQAHQDCRLDSCLVGLNVLLA